MSRIKITPGVTLNRNGDEFLIREISNGADIILEDVFGGKRLVVDKAEIEKDILEGKSTIGLNAPPLNQSETSPFDLLPENIKTEVKRRESYVRELERLSNGSSVKSFISNSIYRVSISINDNSPPSEITLYRWIRKWRESNKTLSALVPRHCNRGKKGFKLDQSSIAILDSVLRAEYLVPERPTLKSVIPSIEERFKNENSLREESDKLAIPSMATIYRFVKNMDAYELTALREGKRAAEHRFKMVGPGLTAEAPLDCVQIDHTVLDIQVIAPVEGFIARPRLTVALDLHSRMPVGIYVGFISPGYESLMLCLRHGILPCLTSAPMEQISVIA